MEQSSRPAWVRHDVVGRFHSSTAGTTAGRNHPFRSRAEKRPITARRRRVRGDVRISSRVVRDHVRLVLAFPEQSSASRHMSYMVFELFTEIVQ